MNYICTNSFPNPPGKPIVIKDITVNDKVVKQAHVSVSGTEMKEHVHKGAIFALGTATEFKDLSPAEKTLVSHLMVSKKIVEATPANIERVQKEVAADEKREKQDAKRNESADPLAAIADVLKTQADALAKLTELVVAQKKSDPAK